MKDVYIALRIYNNFGWRAALQALENNNYTWASGDKPTSLYYNDTQGTIFMNIERKTLTRLPKIDVYSDYCHYYIRVK